MVHQWVTEKFPNAKPPPKSETATGLGAPAAARIRRRLATNSKSKDRTRPANTASAVVAQIAAIVGHAKKHHEIRQLIRCSLRDAIVELEQERAMAAERFIAARRGAP
jgi:hypothetical protein